MMSPIACLRVDAIQLPHARGQVTLRGFQQQVIMIAHETVAMTPPVIPITQLAQQLQERAEVLSIGVDTLPRIAPGGDVVQRARIFDAQRTCHVIRLA